MKHLLLLLPGGLLLAGCVVTRSPGFYSGYKRLTPAEQAQIRFVAASDPIPPPSGRIIYAVAARSLLQTVRNADTTLVYLWGPRCHSQVCASLRSVQAVCQQRGYQLYVVAEYYDMAQISLQPPLQNPLLAVNQNVYHTDYCQRYTQLFSTELRQGTPLPDSTRYARYYLFKGERFVKAMNTLANASPQFPNLQPKPLGN